MKHPIVPNTCDVKTAHSRCGKIVHHRFSTECMKTKNAGLIDWEARSIGNGSCGHLTSESRATRIRYESRDFVQVIFAKVTVIRAELGPYVDLLCLF